MKEIVESVYRGKNLMRRQTPVRPNAYRMSDDYGPLSLAS